MAATPAPAAVASQGAASTAPQNDPSKVSVMVAAPPSGFALDGELAEWGSLLSEEGIEEPAAVGESGHSGGAKGEADRARGLPAASHIAAALTPEGALLAADLGGDSREGIWLSMGFLVPSLPTIGTPAIGGGILDYDCKVYPDGWTPSTPEGAAECERAYARLKVESDAFERTFERLYRLDRSGLRASAPDGTLTAVPGVQVAFKESPGRVTIEARLPALELPRASAAPVDGLRLHAKPATALPPKDIATGAWMSGLTVDPPVSFEPWGALRARVFASSGQFNDYGPPAMSYQPGDPLRYTSFEGGGTAIRRSSRVIFMPIATLGDVEVGEVDGRHNVWLGVLKKRELVDVVYAGGHPGVVKRGNDLHVLSYSEDEKPGYGTAEAAWFVYVVHPDGTFVGGAAAPPEGQMPLEDLNWVSVESFHGKNFETFGFRGTVSMGWSDEGGRKLDGLELSWRWDEKTKTYVARSRSIPVPKPKKQRR